MRFSRPSPAVQRRNRRPYSLDERCPPEVPRHTLVLRFLPDFSSAGSKRSPEPAAPGGLLALPESSELHGSLVVMSALPYQTFRRVFFVGYSEYFKSLLMKGVARLSNIVPVDPDAHLLRAMRLGAGGLHDGRVLCIFPEGARSFDGELLEFKKGASILAHEVGVPIVPVAIHGTHQVWPRDSMRIRLHKVRLTFGPLIAETVPRSAAASKKTEDSYQATTDLLRESVAEML